MPDTKVVSIAIICLALVSSAFVYSHRTTLFSPNTKSQTPNTGLTSAGTVSSATNNSATANWKQAVNDISVITPPSSESLAAADAASGNGTSTDAGNLTAQISKNFMSLYLQDQNNGVAIDDNEATNIADESLNNLPASDQPKQYGISDITIEPASPTAKFTYGGALATTINKNSPNGPSELDVLNAATTAQANGQTPDVSGMTPIIAGYKGMIAAILKIPVPSDAVGLDIVFLNTSSDVLADIQGMSQLNTDPIVAYASYTNYQKDAVALGAIFNDLNAYFGVTPQ